MAEEQLPFLAGALFKWTSMDKPQDVKGRVFLLVQCHEEDQALEMRQQLLKDPNLWIELVNTMRPWHPEMITVDEKTLREHTSIKDIFPYTVEDEH